MKKFALIASILFLGCASGQLPAEEDTLTKGVEQEEVATINTKKFFNQFLFEDGITKAKKERKGIINKREIKGGVVPHHLIASFGIADFFQRLSEPQTIILLSPNHEEAGEGNILTTDANWQTPFGQAQSSQEIINDLVKSSLAGKEDAAFANEHGIGGIIPFVKYYHPQARVVPLIFSANTSPGETQVLADRITEIVKKTEGIIVVSSVDFSHYLSQEQAQEKDQESLEAIEEYDLERIFDFSNDNLDSPAVIAVLLKTMQSVNATELEVLHNTNSNDFLSHSVDQTTSHFVLMWR